MNAPDATPLLRWDPETGQLAQFVPTRVSWDSDGAPLPGSERWIVAWCQPGSGISMRWLTDEEALTWIPVIVLPVPDNADPKLAVMRSVGLFGMAITYDGHVLDPTKVMLSTVSDGTDLVSLQSENARLRSLLDELRTAQPDAATLAETTDTPACACLTWAGDIRVPRPNGHHPLCDGTGQHRAEVDCADPRHAHTLNNMLHAADPDGTEDPVTYQHCADCHGDEHDHLAARGESTVGSGPHCGHTAGCPNC